MVAQQRFRSKNSKSPVPKGVFVVGLTIALICFLNGGFIVALLEVQGSVIIKRLPRRLAANEPQNKQADLACYGIGRPPLEVVPPPSVVPVLPEHICT